MIPNQWYVILESNEVKPGKPVGVTRMGEKLVLWRDEQGPGHVHGRPVPASRRGAQHRQAHRRQRRVPVPRISSTTRRGAAPSFRPTAKMRTPPKAFQVKRVYPAREAHGFIYIWWGEPRARKTCRRCRGSIRLTTRFRIHAARPVGHALFARHRKPA